MGVQALGAKGAPELGKRFLGAVAKFFVQHSAKNEK